MRLDHLLLSKDSIVLSGVFTKYLHSENHVGQADMRVPFGALAQLGEHLLCKQGVVGSIPSSSTKIAWWQQAKWLQDEKSAKKRAIIFDSTLKQSRVRLL